MKENKNIFSSFATKIDSKRLIDQRISKQNKRSKDAKEENLFNSNIALETADPKLIENNLILLLNSQLKEPSKIKDSLRIVRKEISKECLNQSQIRYQIFQVISKDLIYYLSNLLFDFKNSEIIIESLWILNNLYTIINTEFKSEYRFINQNLMKFLQLSDLQINNFGMKQIILEKFFSLVGNLILDSNETLDYFISNRVIEYLIKYMNSSVRTLRSQILRTLNNLLSRVKYEPKKFEEILNFMYQKQLDYYLKFILSNLNHNKSNEECFQFLWLLCLITSYDALLIQKLLNNEAIIITLVNLCYNESYFVAIIRIFTDIVANVNIEIQLKETIIHQTLSQNSCFINIIKFKLYEYNYLFHDIFRFIKTIVLQKNESFIKIWNNEIDLFSSIELIYLSNKSNSFKELFESQINQGINLLDSEYYLIFIDLIIICYVLLLNEQYYSQILNIQKISNILLQNLSLSFSIIQFDVERRLMIVEISLFLIQKFSKSTQQDQIFVSEILNSVKNRSLNQNEFNQIFYEIALKLNNLQ